jgi:hypothetical protein
LLIWQAVQFERVINPKTGSAIGVRAAVFAAAWNAGCRETAGKRFGTTLAAIVA